MWHPRMPRTQAAMRSERPPNPKDPSTESPTRGASCERRTDPVPSGFPPQVFRFFPQVTTSLEGSDGSDSGSWPGFLRFESVCWGGVPRRHQQRCRRGRGGDRVSADFLFAELWSAETRHWRVLATVSGSFRRWIGLLGGDRKRAEPDQCSAANHGRLRHGRLRYARLRHGRPRHRASPPSSAFVAVARRRPAPLDFDSASSTQLEGLPRFRPGLLVGYPQASASQTSAGGHCLGVTFRDAAGGAA